VNRPALWHTDKNVQPVTKVSCAILLAAMFARSQSLPLDVSFKLTDIEYKPLAAQTVRLVFGDTKDWQEPAAGSRFVTDDNGEAHFSTRAGVSRRVQWIPIGFTPFSWPTRTDHLQIAAELERIVPTPAGKDITLHMLYKMDIDRLPDGDCATSDFTSIYTPDAQGRFTQLVPPQGLTVPDSGGMILPGGGYQTWDHMLQPVDEAKTHWKLKLAFKRSPKPVIVR
jgi:hypothetical protein